MRVRVELRVSAFFLMHKSLTLTGKNGTQMEWYRSIKTPTASFFFTAFYVRTSVVRKRNGNWLILYPKL